MAGHTAAAALQELKANGIFAHQQLKVKPKSKKLWTLLTIRSNSQQHTAVQVQMTRMILCKTVMRDLCNLRVPVLN